MHPSGIRLGTPAITTLGADEQDINFIVNLIDKAIKKVVPVKFGVGYSCEIEDLFNNYESKDDIRNFLKLSIGTQISKFDFDFASYFTIDKDFFAPIISARFFYKFKIC